jgi:plasmid stabilization system protein ParE
MYTVLFSERATKDIVDIVDYIAADNPTAAERLGSDVIELALSLKSTPYRGSRVRNRPKWLKLILGNYLIYYRVNEVRYTVEIIRVMHGARIK